MSNGVKENQYNRGLGLPLVLFILAIALAGSGGAYYSIKNQARDALKQQEKAVAEMKELADARSAKRAMMMQKKAVVVLSAQNNSGESGTATLEDMDGKTKVSIELAGAPANTPQPAHIHVGECKNPGVVKYPLSNVVDGKSESVLDVPLNDLRGPQYVINVHKSAKEAKVYVSCGEIIEESMMQKEGEEMMKKDEGMMDKDSMMMKGEIKTFDLTGNSFKFSQKEIRVKTGDRVRINLRSGDWPHNWVVDEFNARTKVVNKNEEASVEFVADRRGSFEYYCGVGNHRQMGMVGKLVVE